MSANTILLGSVEFEELPLHLEVHQSMQALRPSAIEEDEDDARSLLYLFDDNDFERAAAFLAIEEARRHAEAQAHAAAEAFIAAEVQRQRTQTIAVRLRRLLDEDDELVDMLGRRVLATNGYQIPDLWQPHHHHQHYHRRDPRYLHRNLQAGSSHAEQRTRSAPFVDVHAAWDDLDQKSGLSAHPRANPFIHTAPLVLRGHAPYHPRSTQHSHVQPRLSADPTATGQAYATPSTRTSIAIHPLTGVPMLLVEEQDEADEPSSDNKPTTTTYDNDAEAELDEGPIDDESDIDWLGRELLHRRGGANVWVLSADNGLDSVEPASSASAAGPTSSQTASRATSMAVPSKQSGTALPTLPSEIEEVDSDHEPTHDFDQAAREPPALSNSSQRVAAALAQAALRNAGSETQPSLSPSKAGQTRRQRAATVMSESEEEELETVGIPVVDDEEEKGKDEAPRLDGRPRKTVKVVDLR